MAATLAGQRNTILLSEDQFLATLYPGEIATLDDYIRCTLRLRKAIAPLIVELLERGQSVVLDFQANNPEARAWTRGQFETAKADHRLHYLRAPDALCKSRLESRNAGGSHPYQVSGADYDLFTRFLVPPTDTEGFSVILHDLKGSHGPECP